MSRVLEGHLNGEGRRVAVVVSRFNSFVTERLLEGAMDCLTRHGTDPENVAIARVPGSWEIPIAARKLAESGTYDGVICLGAVIRGATPHFDYVAAEVSKGIAAVSLETGVPIAFGVLTTETVEQAVERAGSKAGNKGWDAGATLLEMMDLLPRLS
ncbi:MAG: 6,7-dimethyl-8-ribityllumazine synthase [Spirochaetaceae bacterium]